MVEKLKLLCRKIHIKSWEASLDEACSIALIKMFCPDVVVMVGEPLVATSDLDFIINQDGYDGIRRFSYNPKTDNTRTSVFKQIWEAYVDEKVLTNGQKDVFEYIEHYLLDPLNAEIVGSEDSLPKRYQHRNGVFDDRFMNIYEDPEVFEIQDSELRLNKVIDAMIDYIKIDIADCFDAVKLESIVCQQVTSKEYPQGVIVFDEPCAWLNPHHLYETYNIVYVVMNTLKGWFVMCVPEKDNRCCNVKRPFPAHWGGLKGKAFCQAVGIESKNPDKEYSYNNANFDCVLPDKATALVVATLAQMNEELKQPALSMKHLNH